MIPSLGYMGPDQLDAALKGCDVVVIPAGVPRKPGKFTQVDNRIHNEEHHACFQLEVLHTLHLKIQFFQA